MSATSDYQAAGALPPCPATITRDGAPATGTYAGTPLGLDWRGLTGSFHRSAWWRRFHHKRWHYIGLGNAECFVGIAIVDVGWTNTAFAYVFDRRSRRLLIDASCDGLPGMTAAVADKPLGGSPSWFRFKGMDLHIDSQSSDRIDVFASVGRSLQLQASLTALPGAVPMTAIGPIAVGGCAHATVKSTAMQVHGQLQVDGRSISLDDAWGSFDYSNGLLARETQWRWASAHAAGMGFNLQEGYFGAQENVLWLQGQPIRLGAARFEFDPAQPLQPWHIRTEDGLLDLRFQPEGARQERKNLIVAASYYIQPVGTFHGQVRSAPDVPAVSVVGLLGVTEDHQSKW
ncbi:DUF2804 domain-containing protein [Curvibacter sp. APW13]|uniref:DUF2804 domain-containing protein n=1 Tax=Curvibacter sp. APW13 TaxID=3077236 RepID=UPI0028DE6DA4|nr:DUF2804 domain-containing protein [Curvibacter sp. APW13]MDT8991698.1 DUF2804 domain-containing protein [Curvibacter sp. APW13]